MDITRAILYKYPDAKFTALGFDYAGLTWMDDRPKPLEAELQAAFDEMTERGIDPLRGEDWQGLQDDLRNTPLFAKAIQTSNANGFSLLLSTLATTHSIPDLNFAFSLVRQGLTVDFTPVEIELINTLLTQRGIKLVLRHEELVLES